MAKPLPGLLIILEDNKNGIRISFGVAIMKLTPAMKLETVT